MYKIIAAHESVCYLSGVALLLQRNPYHTGTWYESFFDSEVTALVGIVQ